MKNEDFIMIDLQFLCGVCVKLGISPGQLGVMSSLYREKEANAIILRRLTGMSKSNLYRQLDFLKRKGIIESYKDEEVDDGSKPMNIWKLTKLGKAEVIEFERVYRAHAKMVQERLEMKMS